MRFAKRFCFGLTALGASRPAFAIRELADQFDISANVARTLQILTSCSTA